MNLQEQIAFLEELFDLDQNPRHAVNAAKSEEEKRKTILEFIAQDKENLKNLLSYLTAYGWPDYSTHGKKASDAAFFVIQHSSVELIEKYFLVLQEKAARGEANPVLAAMMEDRMLMWQSKPQIYGTQGLKIKNSEKYYIWPVKDHVNINKRRQNAGFTQTIEQYAAEFDRIYDPSVKIADFS